MNCDDLGYGDLGCYGSAVNDTPDIDRLASEGIRFTDFYMASPVCSPSRGAMLTGCYPRRIGFGTFEGRSVLFPGQPLGLNPNEITIATLLRSAGYATKLVGKWHCGDQKEFLPTRHGFDSYYGLPYSNDMGIQAPEAVFPPLPLMRDDEVIQEQPDQAGLIERYVEECIRFIRENQQRPFFLYLAHMHVHVPHYAPQSFIRKSRNGRYGAAVACVDWAAGTIMHELDRLGLADDTVVVFTSDNGSRVQGEGGSNGVLRGHKGTTWEGGQRVPCIVRWPGHIKAGISSDKLVTAMDLYPTFAEMAGVALPDDRTIDGRNILPLLMDGEADSPHAAFFYYSGDTLEAVRDARWKLHFRKGREAFSGLYDLREDPSESTNAIDEHPEVVECLRLLAEECREDIGDAASGMHGANVRPIGTASNPDTLTHYDPHHPYIIAMYDLPDRG